MLNQVRCFSCNSEISNKYDNYFRYKKELGLSTEDALDKTQIRNLCCRVTVQTTTEVSERVLAAGRPETTGLKRTVVDAFPYPIAKPERKEHVKITQAFAESESVPSSKVTVTEYVNELRPYPKETVVKTKPRIIPSPTKGEANFARLIFEKARWDASDPATFPIEKFGDLPFWPADVVYQIPVLYHSKKTTKFVVPAQTLLKDVIIALSEFILTPVPKFYDMLMADVKSPNVALFLLDIVADGRSPCIYELNVGKTTIFRIDTVIAKPTASQQITSNILFDQIPSIPHRDQTVLDSNLGYLIKGKQVDSLKIDAGSLTLHFAPNVTFNVTDFALHTENGLLEGSEALDHAQSLQDATVLDVGYYEPVFLGRESAPRGMLINFNNRIVLECLGAAQAIKRSKDEADVVKQFELLI